MNTAQFRLDFPEFASAVSFPDAQINFWSGIGAKLISESAFGDLYTQALSLFTAHNIALAAADLKTAAMGGAVGNSTGVVQQKKVGDVSVSYDNSSSVVLNAGHWNLTRYGKQYVQLARLIGTVCYQL